MKDTNELRSSDFYITVYALTQGAKVSYLDRTDPRRVVFVLENVKGGENYWTFYGSEQRQNRFLVWV